MSTQFDPSAKFIKSPNPSPRRPQQPPNSINNGGLASPPPNSDNGNQLSSPHHQQQYQPPIMAPPRHYNFAPYMNPPPPPLPPYHMNMNMISPRPPPPINDRPWSTGLVGCFTDVKNTIVTCACPCFTFGQITEILNEGKTSQLEYAMYFALSPLFSQPQLALLSVVLGHQLPQYMMLGSLILPFLGICHYRIKLRNKFKLEGNGYMDFIFSFFCCYLVLCQQYRQLDKLGYDVSLGWRANKENHKIAMNSLAQLVQPQVPQGMFR